MHDKSHRQRAARSHAFELKSLTADGRFAGYASVFGIIDSQRDIVRKGAFVRSLKSRPGPVQLLWQHHWHEPIGIIEKIFEDARGLYVEGQLLMDVTRAREAFALLKAGALKGLSIGYTVKSFRRNPDSGVRELLDVDLWEVSIVTMPANASAQVTVLKHAKAVAREIDALQCAVKQAMPPRTAMGTKAYVARQQTLAVLEDISAYCFDNQLRQLETKLHVFAGKNYSPDEPRDYHGRWTSGGGGTLFQED